MHIKPKIIKYIILFCSVVFLCLLVLEVSLRLKGYYWKHNKKSEIIMDDDVIGWVNHPGSYIVEGSQTTILNDGLRIKHQDENRRSIKVLLIGGSSVFGWRIPDHDTFAWILEERFPKVSFLNYAVNGHSTFQSLLLLERLFEMKVQPDFIIYGYEDLSDLRNVAEFSWLKSLTQSGQRLPFVTLDQTNRLLRHPLYSYPDFPLMKSSAIVAFLEEWYLKRASQIRVSQAEFITQELILNMDKQCKARGIKFILAFLDGSSRRRDYLKKFLAKNGVAFLDCINSAYQARDKGMLLENDFHPNTLVNIYWADCLQEYLRNNFKEFR